MVERSVLKKSLIIVIDNTNNFNGFVEIDAVGHLSRQSTDAADVIMIIMTIILQLMLMMMFKFICLDRAQMLLMCAGANLTFF